MPRQAASKRCGGAKARGVRVGESSLFGENAAFDADVERVKAVILPDEAPVIGQFIFDVVGLGAGFGDFLAGADGEPLRSSAKAEGAEEFGTDKDGKALRLLFGGESDLIARQFAGGEHQEY